MTIGFWAMRLLDLFTPFSMLQICDWDLLKRNNSFLFNSYSSLDFCKYMLAFFVLQINKN